MIQRREKQKHGCYMSELVISCSMLEDEVREAMRLTGSNLPVLWIDRGLHEYPDKLRAELRNSIDSMNADVILLAFSLCGGALDGLSSKNSVLVVPRFDDCIHFLTSRRAGSRGEVDCRSLYFTAGWFRSERFMGKDYERCLLRYGPQKTKFIFDTMLANYQSLQLIDTHSYDMPAHRVTAEETAKLFGLDYQEQTGSLRILKKLFSHEWDEDFVVVQPGEKLRMEQFIPMNTKDA